MRHRAIIATHPTVVMVDDGTGAFDKDGNQVTIDEVKVLEEIKRLETVFKDTQYQRDRSVEYPKIGDQLDMLYHTIDAGKVDKTSDFYKALKAVKDKHPKG